MNLLLWGPGDFSVSYANRDTSWKDWYRSSGSVIVDMGILLSRMSRPLRNFKCHSDPWPVDVTSQPIRLSANFMTLIPSLTFTELRVVSMERLQRGVASRQGTVQRFAFRTPGTVPLFWGFLQLLRPVLPNLPCFFSTIHLKYPSVLSRFSLEKSYSKEKREMIWRSRMIKTPKLKTCICKVVEGGGYS